MCHFDGPVMEEIINCIDYFYINSFNIDMSVAIFIIKLSMYVPWIILEKSRHQTFHLDLLYFKNFFFFFSFTNFYIKKTVPKYKFEEYFLASVSHEYMLRVVVIAQLYCNCPPTTYIDWD